MPSMEAGLNGATQGFGQLVCNPMLHTIHHLQETHFYHFYFILKVFTVNIRSKEYLQAKCELVLSLSTRYVLIEESKKGL